MDRLLGFLVLFVFVFGVRGFGCFDNKNAALNDERSFVQCGMPNTNTSTCLISGYTDGSDLMRSEERKKKTLSLSCGSCPFPVEEGNVYTCKKHAVCANRRCENKITCCCSTDRCTTNIKMLKLFVAVSESEGRANEQKADNLCPDLDLQAAHEKVAFEDCEQGSQCRISYQFAQTTAMSNKTNSLTFIRLKSMCRSDFVTHVFEESTKMYGSSFLALKVGNGTHGNRKAFVDILAQVGNFAGPNDSSAEMSGVWFVTIGYTLLTIFSTSYIIVLTRSSFFFRKIGKDRARNWQENGVRVSGNKAKNLHSRGQPSSTPSAPHKAAV